jgi:hypothetical protein
LDIIRTRVAKIYLGHPLAWKFGSVYESMARLDLIRRSRVEEDCQNDPLIKTLRNIREEKKIAKKYGFAKNTIFGYRMTRGIPIMNFPDSKFEERYTARKIYS